VRPTDILKHEHRVIEQVLTCLERMAAQAEEQGKVPVKGAADALKFFCEFADGCHHKKEEGKLFPLLESRGLPKRGGPTDVMRFEHEQGRGLIREMAGSLEAAGAGDRSAVETFTRAARAYIEMLRAHIEKEDHCLFNMADSLLAPTDQERLEADFEAVEHDEATPDAHEQCLTIAANLARQFNVPEIVQGEAATHAHCCIH
jgi:hemerythrin-like domain-containing protein